MFLIVFFMVCLKIIDNLFSEQDYYIILQIFLVGITINSLILLFLIMVFRDYKFKPGLKGDIGEMGLKGPKGMPDYCSECNKKENTLGDEKIKNDKKKIRIELPVVSYDAKGEPII